MDLYKNHQKKNQFISLKLILLLFHIILETVYYLFPKIFFLINTTPAPNITKADIVDIKKDLKRASLVIGDNNFESNFALFTSEMNYQGFKDVDGNHKVIDITQSKSYQKKKIKLIDLDYIYHKDDKRISIPKL